jgi:hypothetical protein
MSTTHYSDIVRSSCSSFTSDVAWINGDNLKSFAESLQLESIYEFVHSDSGLSTNVFGDDIMFPSDSDEAGFIFMAHALDFGSGFRPILHEHRNGQGAWLTIRAGLIQMGTRNPSGEVLWLERVTRSDIIQYFDLDHPQLLPLAEFVHADICEIASQLKSLQFTNLGDFIMSHLDQGAMGLVQVLVDTFPLTFKDEYEICGQQVCFYKKAQLVVSELYMRFHKSNPAFKFADVDSLTAFVDNVVVAVMRRYEVVECLSDVADRISSGTPIGKGSIEEVALRAATLTAIERLVAIINDDRFNAQKLCNYFWGYLGKEGSNRLYPRHLAPETSFY